MAKLHGRFGPKSQDRSADPGADYTTPGFRPGQKGGVVKIDGETKRCIRCLKPAKMWGGHVRNRKGEDVLAGWCSKRCNRAMQGYYGPFLAKFGRQGMR
jgi:hypothetical protein